MDLGLDAASEEARKMIDRVDKRLVFKPFVQAESDFNHDSACCLKVMVAVDSMKDWIELDSQLLDFFRTIPLCDRAGAANA